MLSRDLVRITPSLSYKAGRHPDIYEMPSYPILSLTYAANRAVRRWPPPLFLTLFSPKFSTHHMMVRCEWLREEESSSRLTDRKAKWTSPGPRSDKLSRRDLLVSKMGCF